MIDPTIINPLVASKYRNPNTSSRPIDEREKNIRGYTYDLVWPPFGDKFSLPNGYYKLIYDERDGWTFLYDSKNKWTGYTAQIQITDKNKKIIPPKKPIDLIFLNGTFTFKLPKKQKGVFVSNTLYSLIDSIYPKYQPSTPKPVIAKATVIDSKTNQPVKGVKTN